MLEDITVVEIGSRVSTAYCGKLLVDAGAVVVKVEGPGGDPLRSRDPAYAAYLHAGKRSVTGDPPVAAVVICDDEDEDTVARARALRAENPGLVVVSMSDYGLDGPYHGRPATDFTLQAEAGIAVVHPTGDRPPVTMGIELAELVAGLSAATGAVTALLSADAGAAGIDVDVSRFEAVISTLQYPWLFAQIEHHYPYLIPQSPVPGLEKAKDGWVCVIGVTGPQWIAFKKMAAVPELDDARFDALSDRVANGTEVTSLVRRFTEQHTVAELVELGAAHRVPIVPVGTPDALADLVPFATREVFVRNPSGGFLQPRGIFRADGADGRAPGALPQVGEHNGTLTPARRAAGRGQADPRRPLRGMRVLEFGTFQAGPLVSASLAHLGADVIRVEAVNKPDLIRFTGVPPTVDRSWERSGTYIGVNLGKRAISADLSDPRGLELVRKLIACSDVVIDNFAPRVLDERGLGYEGIRRLRPDAVVVRMPAWGLTGPWRDRPGFTYTANAISGLSWMTGYPDGEPLLTATILDPVAALFSSLITVAAIRRRAQTGQGAFVEVPLCDAGLQLAAHPAITASATGRRPVRRGNRGPEAAPQGIYRCADGNWIALSVTSDAQWTRFATMPRAGWASDEKFADDAARHTRHDELDELLSQWCAASPAAELADALRSLGIPAAALGVGTDLVRHPQLVSRDRVFELEHPVAGPAQYLAPAMRYSHAPVTPPLRPAPLFGQHNREVLEELSYSADEIESFIDGTLMGDSPFGLPFRRTGTSGSAD